MAFSNNSKFLLTCSGSAALDQDATVKTIEPVTLNQKLILNERSVTSFPGEPKGLVSVQCSNKKGDNVAVVIGLGGHYIYLLDIESGRVLQKLTDPRLRNILGFNSIFVFAVRPLFLPHRTSL